MKDLMGAVVILFMLMGAADLVVMGALIAVSGLVNGELGLAIVGGTTFLIGAGLSLWIWRQLRG